VPEAELIDVLLVSPGTTAGWRRADAELRRALEELGLTVAVCTSEYRLARHLRRTVLMTDLAEAGAIRRALTKALRRDHPRATVYSSPQAAMLQPRRRLEGATAVRFDVPAALNRQGRGSGLLHALERRALGTVRLLLPIGVEASRYQDVPGVGTPMVSLPIPVEVPAGVRPQREPVALAYAGNPEKKGLDLMVEAWRIASPPGRGLVVTGIEADAGRRFLARRDLDEPPGIEWAGFIAPERYRELSARAEVFLAASRYEDYGLAQLEALAAGCLLVTVPSRGPYEALPIARELEPALVAREIDADALAEALRAALALERSEREHHRERARELLRPYSRETVDRRLRDQVLPALLG
jgi:glycosyltransferase involved in cell wall biosynthesis